MEKGISLTARDDLGFPMEFYAEECDYDDVTLYSLVCPDCYTKLTLVKEHAGVSKLGKLFVRDSYFSHHKMSKWSLDCEKRAKNFSKYSYNQLRKQFPRGQTLKKFSAHLWRMICNSNPLSTSSAMKLSKDLEDMGVPVYEIARCAREYLAQNLEETIDRARDLVDFFYQLDKRDKYYQKGIDLGAREEIETVIAYVENTSKLFHFSVCAEIIEFLAGDTGSELLHHLCFGGLYCASRLEEERGADLNTSKWSVYQFITYALILIVNTFWCTELEKAEKLYQEGKLDRLAKPSGFGQRNKGKKAKKK